MENCHPSFGEIRGKTKEDGVHRRTRDSLNLNGYRCILPTNLMLNLLTVPHPGPAEFFCLKRPLPFIELRKVQAIEPFRITHQIHQG